MRSVPQVIRKTTHRVFWGLDIEASGQVVMEISEEWETGKAYLTFRE